MLEKISNINRGMLIWAREQCHLQIENVSELMEFDVSKWESGESNPNYMQLKSLAHHYRKPLATFFLPEPPNLKNIQSSFRTIQRDAYKHLSYQMVKMIDYARVMQISLYELFSGNNTKIDKFRYLVNLSNDLTPALLRSLLDVTFLDQKKAKNPESMFSLWRDSLFELGIYVFKQPFKDDETSGLCIYDETFPVILVNNSTSFTRQTFSLFHELWHLLSQSSGIDFRNDDELLGEYFIDGNQSIEHKCNKFAGAFLLSDDEVVAETKDIEISQSVISQISKKYKISSEVVTRRLFDNRLISFVEMQEYINQFQIDFIRYSDNGTKESGGNYYASQASYFGDQYLRSVFSTYYSNKINILQVSRYLNMNIQSASSLAVFKGWSGL